MGPGPTGPVRPLPRFEVLDDPAWLFLLVVNHFKFSLISRNDLVPSTEVVVTKRMCLVFLAFIALQCASSLTVRGQTNPACFGVVYCSWASLWGDGCGNSSFPTGAFNCQGIPWEFAYACDVMNNACPPFAAPQENNCPRCNAAGSPISLATGNTYIEQADIRVPGLSNGLTLVRTWISQWPSTQTAFRVGLFGPNWRSTYEERVFVGSDNYIKYARSDGSFWSFGMSSPGTWGLAAPANVAVTLTLSGNPNPTWTMTFQNGEQRIFNSTSGSLVEIIDRNGNTTQLSYDALNRLTTVTDPASRHLYFAYGSDTSRLVTSVTSDVGISMSYAYDGQGRLTMVTKPDQTTISFEYDSNSLITAVKDQNGKILESHTYDSNGRGLTSSKANGVDAVTISYGNQ